MRAQVLHAFDGPDGLGYEEHTDPQIARDDDVLIEVLACGVCHRDITFSRGKFGAGRGRLPTILGHEGVGRVLDAGSAVDDLSSGDRVVHVQFPFCGACDACEASLPHLCERVRGAIGEVQHGAYAERVVLPRRLLHRVPPGVGDEAAAVTACTLGTAHHALRLYEFDPRERIVAINGAGGGVGTHAVQVAAAAGARVVAVTSSESKEPRLRELGADDVVVAPDGRYHRALTRLTRGRGVDLFFETVGAPTLEQSVMSVGKRGRVVVVGNPEGGTCSFNPALMILRGELRMYGTLAVTGLELEEVLDAVAAGRLTPVIDSVAPLQDLQAQMHRMEARQTVGRVVVRP
jgi:D-arabinose 1-dehydrogenase-like Zn-dependent alcohol dehydrogenase